MALTQYVGQLTFSQMQDHSIQFPYSKVFSLFSYISSLVEWLERWVYPSQMEGPEFYSTQWYLQVPLIGYSQTGCSPTLQLPKKQ